MSNPDVENSTKRRDHMRIQARCHCGNISLQLDWPGEPLEIPVRACACSFCVKHGGVWTAHPEARLTIDIADAALVSRYAFGTRTAHFHICARCGAVPVVTSEIEGRQHAVVNVNTFENVDPSRLRRATADFEGESVEARLARRQRNWIADVRLSKGGA
jgi:hypothetical protein